MIFSQIDSPVRWVFLFHALCGSLALLLMVVPLLSKKGGRVHVRTGWAYVALMIGVAITCYAIVPWRVFFDPARSAATQSFALFLAFVATMTLATLWHGIVVLRFKQRKAPSGAYIHVGPPLLLISVALAAAAVGFAQGSPLLEMFPLLGVLVGAGQLKYWLGSPQERKHWLYAHIEGMVGACIATLTAFLVTVVPRLTDASWGRSPVLWIAPGLILGQILSRWIAKDRARDARVASTPSLRYGQ